MVEITKTPRQALADEQFATLAAGRTLAALTGSDKQIPWATDIRARLVADLYEGFRVPGLQYADGGYADDEFLVPKDQLDAAVGILLRIRNADWWIDQRYNSEDEMWCIAADLAAKNAKAAAK